MQVLKTCCTYSLEYRQPLERLELECDVHQEFEPALWYDEVFKAERTLKRFLLICVNQFQKNRYLMD